MYSVANVMISNILGDFLFILFVNEDEGVMFWIGRVVFDPILTWMVSLIFTISD